MVCVLSLEKLRPTFWAQPELREAVVATQESSTGARLVAYVVAQEEGSLDTIAIRERLGRQLPYHMVPGVMMQLEALPLTLSGKIDRKALPEPEIASGESYAPPSR